MRSEPTFVSGRLRLADGRRLTYSDAGPRDGVPVVYCHGAIGTPLEAGVDLETSPNLLGFGTSRSAVPVLAGLETLLPGRSILDFADDVRQVADALAVERFSVVGVFGRRVLTPLATRPRAGRAGEPGGRLQLAVTAVRSPPDARDAAPESRFCAVRAGGRSEALRRLGRPRRAGGPSPPGAAHPRDRRPRGSGRARAPAAGGRAVGGEYELPGRRQR